VKRSPNGATVRWSTHCRPVGAYIWCDGPIQGLTRLAIDCRRVAAEADELAITSSVGDSDYVEHVTQKILYVTVFTCDGWNACREAGA
jgi:hypothetical protein